jgi:hypothetical protein
MKSTKKVSARGTTNTKKTAGDKSISSRNTGNTGVRKKEERPRNKSNNSSRKNATATSSTTTNSKIRSDKDGFAVTGATSRGRSIVAATDAISNNNNPLAALATTPEGIENANLMQQFLAEKSKNSQYIGANEFAGVGKKLLILEREFQPKGKFNNGPVMVYKCNDLDLNKERIWNAGSSSAVMAVQPWLAKGIKMLRVWAEGTDMKKKYYASDQLELTRGSGKKKGGSGSNSSNSGGIVATLVTDETSNAATAAATITTNGKKKKKIQKRKTGKRRITTRITTGGGKK